MWLADNDRVQAIWTIELMAIDEQMSRPRSGFARILFWFTT